MQTEVKRRADIARALRLTWVSLLYNLVETVVGVGAGLAAGSVALLGFGLDSVVESSSATVILWRLRAERSGAHTSEEAERKAIRLIAGAFFVIAAYVGAQSLFDLATGARPEESLVGLVLAAVSVVVMPVLARQKRRVAGDLGSKAVEADSTQTTLCAYISVAVLAGLAANSLFGWWWADAVAGLVIAGLAVKEGRELWLTRDFCC